MRKSKSPHQSLAYEKRGTIGIVLLIPTAIFIILSHPAVPEGSVLDLATDVLAWLFFVLYVSLRLWATVYVGGQKDKELQTQGPYSVTRNPLYLGSLCLAFSITLFFDSLSLLLASCVMGGIYSSWVVGAEERYLEKKFGEDYRKYCQRTPRFLPSFSRYHSDPSLQFPLKALKMEAKRLWGAALIPIFSEIIMHLRMAPWWPHWFLLP